MADAQTIADTVVQYFIDFLTNFSDEADGVSTQAGGVLPYIEQINQMKDEERTTLFVDYQHVLQRDMDLADAIKDQFYYLEPYLRSAVSKVMLHYHEGYSQDREFHVSFFNLPHLCAIRELRTDKIATLIRRVQPPPSHLQCPTLPCHSRAHFSSC